MNQKENLILEASTEIQRLSQCYPNAIEETEKDRVFSFEIKTNQTALSVFPYDDEEPQYCLVNTEIGDNEKGWYEETLFFQKAPTAEESGFLIEGLYGRNIEYYGEPDAEFFGTYRKVQIGEDWATLLKEAAQRHDERTAQKLLYFVRNELRCLGEITHRIGSTESGMELIKQYRETMQDSMRRHLGGNP